MSIHIHTNVITAINAIDANEIDPLVDYGKYLFILDTSNKELGGLRWTRFLKESQAAIDSYETMYGTYHTVGQCIFTPMQRWKFPEPLITELPTPLDLPPPDPTIIPSCY